ncbi:sensor histidine kinase [Falsiroseomonas oryzae]|uniref:sensor histidine kinase n=1 Tax=Falsiroseomonas oryzae TaxID=2766473 RepID=UPI0022EB3FD2|nr:HAMP domain-containing sensor histidine kinase [Roseomonas sp. MO-31]
MTDLRVLDLAKLERELAYYRRECNDLGARLLRLQEEQSQAFREARRSRTVAKLIREAHRLADHCATPEEIGSSMLEVIVENTLCDRAAFVRRESSMGSVDVFRVTHAIGFGSDPPADTAAVPSAPAFFLTTARSVIETPAYELTGILRMPYVLWAYDKASGHALILGNQSESNVSRPFETGDQELVEGALSVYIDVMARKQAEVDLRIAKATAEEASALRARFIATLSHELRTPLNAIIGFSDMMLPGSTYRLTEHQLGEYAQQINDSGRLLLELINDILDYSSLAKVAPQLLLTWARAETLIGASARELSALAMQNDVQIELRKPEAGLELNVDQLRFRQVLNNLISNAVKFTGSGGTVTVSARRRPDGTAELVVRDTGVGMKPEDIPRALEPFQQIDGGHARSFPGTGLGLPIAKGLVEAHGGTLRIVSAPGEGTAVTIQLPATAVRVAPPPEG